MRRWSAIRRVGWPGWVSVPTRPSGRVSSTEPDRRSSVTEMMPCALELLIRFTGTLRYSASQPASSSVDGESASPVTVAPVTFSYGGRSSAETSWARQRVSRVHARSVSPST